jgi:hypothetical protein
MDIRLAIVGGRDFTDTTKFEEIVNNYINEIGTPSLIISGGAKGVDNFAENHALKYNIPTLILKPDWSKGKHAGLLRNTDIVNESTHVLALPTINSKGTYDSINKATKINKIVKIVQV